MTRGKTEMFAGAMPSLATFCWGPRKGENKEQRKAEQNTIRRNNEK